MGLTGAWSLNRRSLTTAPIFTALFACLAQPMHAQDKDTLTFWASRNAVVTMADNPAVVRIGVWDSGVDTTLFRGRIARGESGQLLIRGYNPYKQRADVAMSEIPAELLARRDELNATLQALDDLDSQTESAIGDALNARLDKMSKEEISTFDDEMGRWSGYVHGTGVADIAIAGNAAAELVIARMEWWHGAPPVPCWSRELAVREADSMRDLLEFLVASGVRVVNMSWSRFESSYLDNLAACAPAQPLEDRQALARFTVDTIRSVLRAGMAKAPRVLFVGAAGNAGTTVANVNSGTRFAAPNFMVVGAVDRFGSVTTFTNTGPEVTLYANGERVPARLPGGPLSFGSGTSMAAPVVVNAAAKMLALNPSLSGAEVRTILERTAEPNSTGQPVLHPSRALEAARRRR